MPSDVDKPFEEIPLRVIVNPSHPCNRVHTVVLRPTARPVTIHSVWAIVKSFVLNLLGVPVLGWELDVAEVVSEPGCAPDCATSQHSCSSDSVSPKRR